MTHAQLTREMTERELKQWKKFRKQALFPLERIELYLAQVAQVVAGSMGARGAKLADYIIELRDPDEDHDEAAAPTEVDVKALQKVFEFKPRRKK